MPFYWTGLNVTSLIQDGRNRVWSHYRPDGYPIPSQLLRFLIQPLQLHLQSADLLEKLRLLGLAFVFIPAFLA
jgi:hypothetical protein